MKASEINNKEIYFGNEIDNHSLTDLLCLKAIIQKIQTSNSTIQTNDISTKILFNYWKIKFNKDNTKFMNQDLNDIKSSLISKYGLSNVSSEQDIEQIINYIQDKHIKLKLLALTKASLRKLAKSSQNIVHDEALNIILKKLGLNNQELLSVNSNNSISINKKWHNYIKEDGNCFENIDEFIEYKLNNDNSKNIIKTKIDTYNKKEENVKDFNKIKDIEKRINFHISLNQKQYYCMEDSFMWLNTDLGQYEELHDDYLAYIRQHSVQAAAKNLPIVSCVILVYTAVYRYNEDDASGFWPEFFENPNYSYQRDVPCIMNCLKKIIRKYNIDFTKRQYLKMKNMSIIFSQIIIPDISLRKIYSAIYAYYFRNTKISKPINRLEFLSDNEYRLDKPSIFFLSEDEKFKDTFNNLVELVSNTINNHVTNDLFDFPKRFYKAINHWKSNEKKELDSHTIEFYISNPNICLDYINNNIFILLPTQKNRLFSDENLGWNITIDNKDTTVYGRIIRKNSGDFLVLEEKFSLKSLFETINVEYFYNNKPQKSWDFKIDNEHIIFDKNGKLLNNDTLPREGCYLGITKGTEIDEGCVVESYIFEGWSEYIFYYLDLSQYPYSELSLNNQKKLQIEDKPVIERCNYKLLFEDWNTESIYSSTNVFKSLGTIDIIAPFINKDDIKIIFFDLEINNENKENNNNIDLISVNKNLLRLTFNNNLKSGIYNIKIKYKEKTCYTEMFVYDCETKVKFSKIDYYKEPIIKSLEVHGGNNVEIVPCDLNTKIKKTNSSYLIQTKKISVSKFIYKFNSTEVLIHKIVRPIKYDLSGLEDTIESNSNDKVIEITKEIMQDHSINLYIRNLDHNYDYLIYNLVILDNITGKEMIITEKLKLGQEMNWNFRKFSDRIIDFKDILLVLEIRSCDSNIIIRIPVLKIKEHIKINNFKKQINENQLYFSWNEKQKNKQRRLYLYNVTLPSENPLEYKLEDGVTNFKLDLSKIYPGVYIPILRFKKDLSLFNISEGNRQFFTKKDMDNIIVNHIGYNCSKGQLQLQKCIWMTCNDEYELLNSLVHTLDFSNVDIKLVLYSIIQMKDFSNVNDNVAMKSFLDTTYKVLEETLNHTDKDKLIKTIMDLSYDFIKKDTIFLINCVITFYKHNNISSDTIDNLAEIDLISALSALENGQTELSNNIIMQCRKKFDIELLSPDVLRNQGNLFDIISSEVDVISDFWIWLISYSNKYLLSDKYNYSKARIFRIYEEEHEISTYKVLGRTLDDMVDNMINNNIKIPLKLLSSWSYDFNVNKELYNNLLKLIEEKNQSQFKNSIIAAFVAVTKLSSYSNKEYFNLVMTYHMSNQNEIFNRYRAYFKLMLIQRRIK